MQRFMYSRVLRFPRGTCVARTFLRGCLLIIYANSCAFGYILPSMHITYREAMYRQYINLHPFFSPTSTYTPNTFQNTPTQGRHRYGRCNRIDRMRYSSFSLLPFQEWDITAATEVFYNFKTVHSVMADMLPSSILHED